MFPELIDKRAQDTQTKPLAALRAVAPVLLGRLGQDTVPDAIRWVSYEVFTRPLDVIGLP